MPMEYYPVSQISTSCNYFLTLCPTAGKPRSFVYQIPLNSNGIPILPDIVDASEATASQLAQLLDEYLLSLWSAYLIFILCLIFLKFPS